MNWDFILALIGAIGGLETLKWFATRRHTGRMAQSEADEKETAADMAREHMHEEIILFLQNQLRDKELRYAELSERLQQAMTRELDLTARNGELQMRLLSTRCDLTDCNLRKPPLPWRDKNKEDVSTTASLQIS